MYPVIPVETYYKLHEEHLKGSSLKTLSITHKMRYGTLYYGFKRLGLEVINSSNEERTRSGVDHNYFAKIDCENKAYILGLIMSDGCVNFRKDKNKSPRLMLKLFSDDKYIVEWVRDQIAPKAKLSKDKNSFRFEVTSSKLINDLMSLGVLPNKTTVGEQLPLLDKIYYPHFIRGFFDGDGSFSMKVKYPNKPNVNICSIHKNFLQDVVTLLDMDLKIYEEKRDTMNMFRILFTSHTTRIKFFNYMYENCSICMKRKYEPYSKYVNAVLNKETNKSLSV